MDQLNQGLDRRDGRWNETAKGPWKDFPEARPYLELRQAWNELYQRGEFNLGGWRLREVEREAWQEMCSAYACCPGM